MEKGKIYLSLPISGYDIEERRVTAQKMEDKLLADGWQCVANPLKNGLPVDADTHDHMKRDFKMLLECDAVLFMEKFLHSAGCKVEFDVATACGLGIYFEECFDINSIMKFR